MLLISCSIPAKYKACLACNDGEHEFIAYRYRFFFRLEDEEGEQIHVSVGDEQVHVTPNCSAIVG